MLMSILTGVLFTVELACAILLIGIILIQQSKREGGLGAIGGGMTESVFGAATGNILTRTTVILASIFLVTTLVLAALASHRSKAPTLADRLGASTPAPASADETAAAVTSASADAAPAESASDTPEADTAAPADNAPATPADTPPAEPAAPPAGDAPAAEPAAN